MGIPENINLGKKGKFGNINLNNFHGGLKKFDVKSDEIKTIFDKFDINKDETLSQEEIQELVTLLGKMAKNGKISNREIKRFLKENGLKGQVNKESAFEFLNQINNFSKEQQEIQEASESTEETVLVVNPDEETLVSSETEPLEIPLQSEESSVNESSVQELLVQKLSERSKIEAKIDGKSTGLSNRDYQGQIWTPKGQTTDDSKFPQKLKMSLPASYGANASMALTLIDEENGIYDTSAHDRHFQVLVDEDGNVTVKSVDLEKLDSKLKANQAEYARDAEIRRQQAETTKQEREYYQKLGVENFNDKGKRVKADGWGDKEFEVIGDVGYGRQLVKCDGKLYTRSHDGKILREDYLQAHKAFVSKSKDQRNNTVSGIEDVTYVKDDNGKVWYFDEKTGKAIVKGDYQKIVKQESAFVAEQLHTAAKGMGTDEKLLEQGVRNIYSQDILQGVNEELKTKDGDYMGNAQTMPVEALILDEMSHTAARPLFKTLINSGAMTTEEQAQTVKREIEYEVHGGLTGYTSASELNNTMQLCSDRDVRLEVETQFKKDHPELTENEGSVVRSYIAGDGWNAQEVDQFDANWIKTGAYQEARYVYQTDEKGNIILDNNGQLVVVVDEGDQAHRNNVIGRLVFDYQDKEALNKGLDVVNDNPNSFDYQYLDQRAGQEIAKEPQGKYQSRFTNQDNVQRYLAGFHSDETGNVNAGNVSASNTSLFKGEKPARVQAEEILYNAKDGNYSQTFDSMDAETYSVMSELIANGDVKDVKDMTDLYNKALNSVTDKNDKTKIKANAMLSGQINFTDTEIANFCVELMHSIDNNRGCGGSTGMSAGYTNSADYQTEQLKVILQNNPQVMSTVKAKVEQEDFSYITTISSGGEMPTTNTFKTNTKDTYIQLLNDTKNIVQDEEFYDADGNKITDPQQIQQIKSANMQSLEAMRQYVAELERDYKKGVDTEGVLSDMANGLSRYSGLGTDRDDVATEYQNAKLMLQQFEAAAQGKLRDSQGNVISAQDLAQQMLDKQNALSETNSDYKQTIAYGKMGIVLAPVIVATTIASGGAAAAGWTSAGVAVAGGVAAGTTTYGVNALEYNTSYTGNTAEAREQNLEDSLVNGIATGIGISQMKYIGGIANNMGTTTRTAIRLGTTVAADTGVGATAEYVTTGNVSAQGIMTVMAMSGVGNVIGAKSLGKKQGSPTPHPSEGVQQNIPPANGRNEIADTEVLRNINQSHLNGRDREMIAREMDSQRTPTPQESEVYAKEHGYQEPTAEQKAAIDAMHEQNAAQYAETHRIENNAHIVDEQKSAKVPLTADEAAVKILEDEVKGLDGQILRLNKQLYGAKRANQMGRKNSEDIKKLESQIESLQQKRNAKMAELETAKKPVEVKPEVKSDNAESGEILPKGRTVIVPPDAKLNLAETVDFDLADPAVKVRIDALKEGESFTVGREGDIRIDDPTNIVSRKHLEISKQNGKIVIKDISSNGTKITNIPAAPKHLPEINENELVRNFGNDGKAVNPGYIRASQEARAYLNDSIESGRYTDSFESYVKTINEMHKVSVGDNWYGEVGKGSMGVKPGIIRGEGAMRNGRISEAMWVQKIAQKYGDNYNPLAGESVVQLKGIPDMYKPRCVNLSNTENGYIHFYPNGKSMNYYFNEMHRTAKEAVNLINSGASEREILAKLAEHYQYAANARPYSQINNSLFMNEINTLLHKAGMKGMPHGMLDHAAQRLQPETFQKYFTDEYYRTAIK